MNTSFNIRPWADRNAVYIGLVLPVSKIFAGMMLWRKCAASVPARRMRVRLVSCRYFGGEEEAALEPDVLVMPRVRLTLPVWHARHTNGLLDGILNLGGMVDVA
jgi:hypothetical protein